MQIEIDRITILTGNGADEVVLYVNDMISGTFPYHDQLTLSCKVAAGQGEQYCLLNFPGVEIKLIEV